MYSGRVVERASARAIFEAPQHPYTVGLLGSIPRLDVSRERLASIEGQVPDPLRRPAGCNFADRCPFAIAKCRSDDPPLMNVGDAHLSACWRAPLDPDALVPQPAPAVAALA
jgi:oligopeptide/dipeptide ABC transporter ATP-binding protein